MAWTRSWLVAFCFCIIRLVCRFMLLPWRAGGAPGRPENASDLLGLTAPDAQWYGKGQYRGVGQRSQRLREKALRGRLPGGLATPSRALAGQFDDQVHGLIQIPDHHPVTRGLSERLRQKGQGTSLVDVEVEGILGELDQPLCPGDLSELGRGPFSVARGHHEPDRARPGHGARVDLVGLDEPPIARLVAVATGAKLG